MSGSPIIPEEIIAAVANKLNQQTKLPAIQKDTKTKGSSKYIQISNDPSYHLFAKTTATLKECKIYENFFHQLEKRTKNNNNNATISTTTGKLQQDITALWYLTKESPKSKNFYLIVQDLSSKGYSPVSCSIKHPPRLDFNQALIAMQTLAKLHANSYFYQGSKSKARTEILPNFAYLNGGENFEKILTPIAHQLFEFCCTSIESENSSVAFKLRKRIPSEETLARKMWTEILVQEKYENDDLYVFCHGDLRPDNIFFDSAGNNCKLVSWDSLCYAPLGSDLAHFMLICLDGVTRDEFEEKLLAFYCDAFEEELEGRIKDFDVDEFHRNVEDQYRRMMEWAFYRSCFVLPVLFCKERIGTSFGDWVRASENVRREWLHCVRDSCMDDVDLRKRLVEGAKKLIKLKIL